MGETHRGWPLVGFSHPTGIGSHRHVAAAVRMVGSPALAESAEFLLTERYPQRALPWKELPVRKRDLVRHIPPFAKLVGRMEHLEAALDEQRKVNDSLRDFIAQLVFSDVASLVDQEVPGSDGMPIPGPALRFMVAKGYVDREIFLREGEEGARFVVDMLAKQGQAIDQVGKLLDFGCGCGRVIRHLKGCGAEQLHGCDVNPIAIEWCQRFLDFATFKVNALEPPLPYPDNSFGLIYTYSVFTHLSVPLQTRWMDEMRRVLAPGGYLLLTVHGHAWAFRGLPNAQEVIDRGEIVVFREDRDGSNICCAFHPERYVREVLARGFEVLDFIPEGAKVFNPQDSYLLRLIK